LKNVEALGSVLQRTEGIAAPSLRSSEFNMASISDAV